MGLDVTAYKKLAPQEPLANEDEEYDAGLVRFYDNTDFPGRIKGVRSDVPYNYEDEFDFRAGSCGGYNEWRRQLARLGGYTPEDAWHASVSSGPFYELINFSDCEGTIGPEVSAKLAKDFADFQEKANSIVEDVWFAERYGYWRKAFEMAADGGAVSLH